MSASELRSRLDQHGLIARREHRAQAASLDWLLRSGEVTPVLPGVYRLTSREATPELWAHAVAMWNPRAVITGRLAARCWFAPGLPVAEAEVALANARRLQSPFRLHRVAIPTDGVTMRGNLRLTTPAVSALWTAAADGGELVDFALQTGAASPSDIVESTALLRGLRGAPLRGSVAELSSGNPWSAAERVAHQLLRDAGITGWKGNVWFHMDGLRFPVDIVFPRQRLAIEVDSREWHSSGEAFERDRRKTNALVRAGWTVVHVTWAQLLEDGYFVTLVRDLLRCAA